MAISKNKYEKTHKRHCNKMKDKTTGSALHEKLKDLRRHKKISQSMLAEKIGVSQSNYNKIENGLAEISVNRFFKVLEILEVSIEDFFGIQMINEQNENCQTMIRLYTQMIARDQELISQLRENALLYKERSEELQKELSEIKKNALQKKKK